MEKSEVSPAYKELKINNNVLIKYSIPIYFILIIINLFYLLYSTTSKEDNTFQFLIVKEIIE